MSLVNQLLTRYEWTPSFRLVYKKHVPQGLKTFRVQQTNGISGWLIFTYDKKTPVCLWVNSQECIKLPCAVDERICGDTFLKVERIGPMDFVIADIWLFNSNCIFACSTFKQRYDWLQSMLNTFVKHVPGTIRLIHKSTIDYPTLRGYEEHTLEEPGKFGYFIEKEHDLITVVKMNIPDCYDVGPGKGYLRVPDIRTSVYLRSKGDRFECKCTYNNDESWTLIENIPDID